MKNIDNHDGTDLEEKIEEISRSISAISRHLRIQNTDDTYDILDEPIIATLIEPTSDEHYCQVELGNRVRITNTYKGFKGIRGIILKVTKHFVRIGITTGRLITKRRDNIELDN